MVPHQASGAGTNQFCLRARLRPCRHMFLNLHYIRPLFDLDFLEPTVEKFGDNQKFTFVFANPPCPLLNASHHVDISAHNWQMNASFMTLSVAEMTFFGE